MAKGNEIVVTANPKGNFLGGTIKGAVKPGILVQVRATPFVGGKPVFEPFAPGTDGKTGWVGVLMADSLQGKLATDALTDGAECQVYCPVKGDYLNVLAGEVAGTGNTYALGDMLGTDAEDGLLVPDSSFTVRPFVVLEAVTQQAAPILLFVMYTGG